MSTTAKLPNPIPLVMVEGFLSTASSVEWNPLRDQLHGFKEHLGDRDLLVASVGPVSSLHDRACELYYCLKGGTVDYGVKHASEHNHERFGRQHQSGLYPEWSTSNPLHFLGHSMGGSTIVKLQALLAQKHFSKDDHPDMILSVTSVSAPFRGTQLVYTLGESTKNAPDVRPWSIGSMLTRAVHILSYLAPSLPHALDLHADARHLSYTTASFSSFLKQLWKSDWAESKDATPYDVTFEAADDREGLGEGTCYPNTFYKSYAAYMTEPSNSTSRNDTHAPPLSMLHLQPLYPFSWAIGTFDFDVLTPRPSFLHRVSNSDDVEAGKRRDDQSSEEYWANDGVVPLFSQWHPFDCSSIACKHHDPPTSLTKHLQADIEGGGVKPSPGTWHVHTLPGTHHLSIISIWLGTTLQRKFWVNMHDYLTSIDIIVSPKTSASF